MGPDLLKHLSNIISNPKERSKKWLSSSVPQAKWNQPHNNLCSAQYHTNNLLGSVLFEEALEHLPANAITIEIAPHALLRAILQRAMPDGLHFGLTKRRNLNGVEYLLNSFGK